MHQPTVRKTLIKGRFRLHGKIVDDGIFRREDPYDFSLNKMERDERVIFPHS